MSRLISVIFLSFTLAGCATTKIPSNLSTAILDSEDLQTVQDGLPSYLLMVDALTLTYPKNAGLHLTASSLNGSYAGVFIPDDQAERKVQMAEKALDHAFTAICLHEEDACELKSMERETFEAQIQQFDSEKDAPFLYALGTAWASYIQANSADWLAVAQLGQAEAVLKQLVSIDAEYERGMGLLYLGVMNSILPPSLGGKPDIAKDYFDRALAAGQEQNLIIYVYYASNYARLLFDQELHDSLLQQVLTLEPKVKGLTLQNLYAQELAQSLLDSSNDYF